MAALNEVSLEEKNQQPSELHGLLVSFEDDQLDECVRSALKRKSRVRYKCMDTFSNFLAFGTSGGAIYLYKLKSVTHSSCSLISMIPCDQGAIEVVKFLPNPQTDDLLLAIGTSRGSLVVFGLTHLLASSEQNPICSEIYRAESFTNNCAIKLIEYDQDLFDSTFPFSKLYICDVANRLYVVDSSTIYASKQTIRIFYTNHLPSLIFSANDSKINQISVHRSQLLISTDETTRLFNEQTNQLSTIGKKKRREGFYGACFFNPNYKPTRILNLSGIQQQQHNSQNSVFSSTASINDLENLIIFVARPAFRLWQVNNQLAVKFTHQFEPLIKSSSLAGQIVSLHNEPIGEEENDDSSEIIEKFKERSNLQPAGDHFQKLVPLYSSTLGNLLLSYTQNELFVVDPIGAKLIVWHRQEATIIQVCCSENELFIWSLVDNNAMSQREFQVQRLILLAPTQFVLELHRLHRFWSIIVFVQMFSKLFRQRMALPLDGASIITTEGGLLRNVLLNAWDMYESKLANNQSLELDRDFSCEEFKKLVEEIVEESKQLRHSLENLTDSRFFLTMTSENIDRLCSEPYASLVSLEVSIADLHSNHVIHFSKDALNRHKSVANLSRTVRSSTRINQLAKSNYDLTTNTDSSTNGEVARKISNPKVIVERIKPNKLRNRSETNGKLVAAAEKEVNGSIQRENHQPFFSPKEAIQEFSRYNEISEDPHQPEEVERNGPELDLEQRRKENQCNECLWPRRRVHLKHLDSIQQVQLKWIENNLLDKFEENLSQIEETAFKHGLWNIYLKCLARRENISDYITCCILLDDVKLLEPLITCHSFDEETLFEQIFEQLSTNTFRDEGTINEICLKCGAKYDTDSKNSESFNVQLESDLNESSENSFELVNLVELFIMQRDANVKKIISKLLKYPKIVNKSNLTSTFFLKVIATQVANQSTISKARREQSQGSRESMLSR